MGQRYSLCAILRRADDDMFLRYLAPLLTAESGVRIANSLWRPTSERQRETLIGTVETGASGISGLELEEGERDNSYGFSLEAQLEPELEVHVEGSGFDCFERKGPFGNLWTSVHAGSRYVLLQMTAATSGMSRVLRESETIHEMWRGFAESAGAMIAYVDLEDAPAIQIYPGSGDVDLPDTDTLSFADDFHFSVDLMAEYVRRSNLETR